MFSDLCVTRMLRFWPKSILVVFSIQCDHHGRHTLPTLLQINSCCHVYFSLDLHEDIESKPQSSEIKPESNLTYRCCYYRSCEKVMFLYLSVIHSVHRGCVCWHASQVTIPGHLHPLPPNTHSPPPPSSSPETSTEVGRRILLECIAVR